MWTRLVILLLFAASASAEIITTDRSYPWTGNVGVSNGIPNSSNRTVYTTISAGASAATVQTAINNCPANQVVQLAAGSYSWSGGVNFDSANNNVVVRGAGSNTVISISSYWPAVFFVRGTAFSEAALSQEANLSADATKGGTTISVASVPAWVTVGDLIGIDQLDDSSFVDDTGTEGGNSYRAIVGNGARGLGQLCLVLSKTTTNITIETPLIYGFKTSQTAQIFQPGYDPSAQEPKRGIGIENLTIVEGASGADCRSIYFDRVIGCWVKNVNIITPADKPIFAYWGYRCEVRGCYIKDPRLLGAGQGYGIALYHLGTGWLVEDNIIEGSHNALTVNYGGGANVFAYNYEIDGTSDSGQNPGMNTHGTHPAFNLWEGNYCEDKMLADWTHGSSSHNTVFRNRVTGENGTADSRCCISIEYYNRYWNIVGNVLGVNGLQNKYLEHSGSTAEGTQGSILKIGGEVNINNDFTPSDAASYTNGGFILIHGNWDFVQDAITWEANVTDKALPDSLYLSSKPDVFGSLSWPPFNPTNTTAAAMSFTNIPAGYRYTYGTNPPAAGEEASSSTANIGTLYLR